MRPAPLRLALLFGLALVTAGAADFSSVRPFAPTPAQRARLEAWLASQESNYNPETAMLRAKFSSPGYHTTLKGGLVHRTRDSLAYALALLDSGDAARRDRAAAIVRKVVSLQDTDPASRTYGIWSWFLEEPLAQMSPPDWNWADFNGVSLLQIARDHRHRLPPDLVASVDAAIVHAARAIMKRNVGPDYTNIALMGTYVTRLAGEHYGHADLRDYGAERLRRFQRRTREIGGFAEYNSPTYTVIALEEIGRMRRDFTDPELRAIIEELYTIAWEEIALHFHVPSGQWAGPHSRTYGTLTSGSLQSLLQESTGGRYVPPGPTGASRDYRLSLPCPEALVPYFVTAQPRSLTRTYGKGTPDILGTSVLTADWALGTINRGDFWNQRRPVIVYFGPRTAPSFARVRVLRDHYDFAAAQVRTEQRQGAVLTGVSFATDGGVTHVSLDRMKDSTFSASDLRLRFELGGAAGAGSAELPTLPAALHGPVVATPGGLPLRFSVPLAAFGELTPRWETSRSANESGRDGPTVQADLVLYAGPTRTFRLADLTRAGFVFTFEVGAADSAAPRVELEQTGERAQVRWAGMELQVPLKPAPAAALRRD